MIFLHINNKQNYAFKRLYFSWYKQACWNSGRLRLQLLCVFGLSSWKSWLFTWHATIFTIWAIPSIFGDKNYNCTFPQGLMTKRSCWLTMMQCYKPFQRNLLNVNNGKPSTRYWNKPINIIFPMTPQLLHAGPWSLYDVWRCDWSRLQ